MRVLVCSSTYDEITHGPAKFTRLLMEMSNFFPEVEIRLLSRGIKTPVTNQKYRIKGWYPKGIGIFWEYFDNYKYLKAVKEITDEWIPDIIVFVDLVLGFLTAVHFRNRISIYGLINDDEYIRNDISKLSFSKEWLIKWKSRLLEKKSAHSMDKVIANSNFLKKEISQKYKIDHNKIARLYKAIKIEDFPYVERPPIEIKDEILVLFVKSDFKRGGLFELINALQSLHKFTFKLFICGPGQEHKSKIIKKTGDTKNIELVFEYKTLQSRVKELLYQCHIFCTPALREALGVANIEALATGLPVVGTQAGGIPEVLCAAKGGWLAMPGNVNSLAETIESCLTLHSERTLRSKFGREHVQSNFDHLTMYENLYKLFQSD